MSIKSKLWDRAFYLKTKLFSPRGKPKTFPQKALRDPPPTFAQKGGKKRGLKFLKKFNSWIFQEVAYLNRLIPPFLLLKDGEKG